MTSLIVEICFISVQVGYILKNVTKLASGLGIFSLEML